VAFARDANHWLLRFSPDEWSAAAMSELRRAEDVMAHAYAVVVRHDANEE
jgi:hypothetical protein